VKLKVIDDLLGNRLFCLWLSGVVWFGGFAAFAELAQPFSSVFQSSAAGMFLSSVVCMGAAFVSLAFLLRGKFNFGEAAALLAVGILANLMVYSLFAGMAARMVVGFSIIAGGFGLGSMLARLVETPRHVMPIGIVAAVADTWSVFTGPTKRIMESKNAELAMKHAFVGQPGAEAAEVRPVAGAADLVFVALFLCIAARLGLSVWKSAVGMFAGLVVGLAAATLWGGLPGLPFIAGGFVIANWKRVRPGKTEIVKTSIFVAALLLAFAAVALITGKYATR